MQLSHGLGTPYTGAQGRWALRRPDLQGGIPQRQRNRTCPQRPLSASLRLPERGALLFDVSVQWQECALLSPIHCKIISMDDILGSHLLLLTGYSRPVFLTRMLTSIR